MADEAPRTPKLERRPRRTFSPRSPGSATLILGGNDLESNDDIANLVSLTQETLPTPRQEKKKTMGEKLKDSIRKKLRAMEIN